MNASTSPMNGIVTSPHQTASDAGLRVMQHGGNAVEAAVAVAATLAVVYPHMTGLGGDSFWLIRSPSGDLFAVDACGAAGHGVNRNLFISAGLDAIPFRGAHAAITVAGTVSGWDLVLEKAGGQLPLRLLLEEAIQLAQNGVPVTQSGATVAATKDAELASIFGYADTFRPNGRPLQVGDTLAQPALARTMERLAENGLQDFYSGSLAKDIADDLADAGSPLSAADLENHAAFETCPLHLKAFSADIHNFPPPTQGLSSLLILALYERIRADKADGFDHVHRLVEATKKAFSLARKIGIGDPRHMTEVAQDVLDDTARLDRIAAEIDLDAAAPWPEQTQAGDTTWFGTMDKAGWCVSAIQSTYFEFGSGIVLPKTGITWQNRGASFTLAEDGWNTLEPGRKPFHTLNPALALFNDGRRMVYGTMGGEGQPQTQAAIFTRYAQYGVALEDAISAPRWLLGRTWGETSTSLKLESRLDPALIAQLGAAGHETETLPDYSETMGHAGALLRHPDGSFDGATDPRSDGGVAAW